MAKKLPKQAFYNIRASGNQEASFAHDVELLYNASAYVSGTILAVVGIEALSAGAGDGSRSKFVKFVKQHFADLDRDLGALVNNASGADALYARFRNGLAHVGSPKKTFALAEDHEVSGAYAAELEVDGIGKFIAINVDRFLPDFVACARALGGKAGP